jgi:hypothetical protein
MKISVVLCYYTVGVSAFSTHNRHVSKQPKGILSVPSILGRESFTSVVGHYAGDTSSSLHMAFVGGDPVNEEAMVLVPPPSNPLQLEPEVSPAARVNTMTTVHMESDYAVEQTRSELSLPFWEQPSVWVGRLMALTAAAMYGTNFASIKILNDSLPVSLASSLRFGMGALGFSIFVLLAETATDDKIPAGSHAELYKERAGATWAGGEVGLWYAVGCIAQAVALLEVDASKVRSLCVYHCSIAVSYYLFINV